MRRLGLWDGSLPAPAPLVRVLETVWFGNLRRPETISAVLATVYADESAVGERLVTQIMDPAQHPLAAKAFASIMFAPQSELPFDEAVTRLKCPVALLYGRDDPWVRAHWAPGIWSSCRSAGDLVSRLPALLHLAAPLSHLSSSCSPIPGGATVGAAI